MQVQHLEHKHGGRITEITAIEHDTENKRAFWHFRGNVKWNDGSESKGLEISPIALCYDHDDQAAAAECNAAMERLNDYLARNGEWSERGSGWNPKAKRGSEALA